MDNLSATLAAFNFTIRGDATARRQIVPHPGIEIKEAHRQYAAAIANLTHHHPAATKGDVRMQHFAFYCGPDTGQQIINGIELGTIFVA